MKEHLKRNWKRYLVAAAGAAAIAHGVDPTIAQNAVLELLKLFGQ